MPRSSIPSSVGIDRRGHVVLTVAERHAYADGLRLFCENWWVDTTPVGHLVGVGSRTRHLTGLRVWSAWNQDTTLVIRGTTVAGFGIDDGDDVSVARIGEGDRGCPTFRRIRQCEPLDGCDPVCRPLGQPAKLYDIPTELHAQAVDDTAIYRHRLSGLERLDVTTCER